MRYFHSCSASATVVRKKGYYPSDRAAARLAIKLCYVWGDENHPDKIEAVANALSRGLPFDDTCRWAAETPGMFIEETDAWLDMMLPIEKSWGGIVRTRRQIRNFYGNRLSLLYSLSPSEEQMLTQLQEWWVADEGDEALEQKCFIAANLNQGRTLVVIER